jgi:hypothetical protein
MSEESSPQTVSLNDIALKYTQAIQHLSDLAVFEWAAARTVSEQGYDEVARGIPGLPATQFRLPFEVAKEAAERSALKHSINEALGLVAVFLDDIRKLTGLVVFNAARMKASNNLATLAAELNAAPPPDFPGRLQLLRQRIGSELPLEKEILSLVALARTLFHRNGVIGEGEVLHLNLKVVQPPAEGETEARIGNYERQWKAGEPISLSRQEHAAVFTTVSIFFNAMLGTVQEFAKSSGILPEPALQ